MSEVISESAAGIQGVGDTIGARQRSEAESSERRLHRLELATMVHYADKLLAKLLQYSQVTKERELWQACFRNSD
jgi:hypothetical protein